MVFHQCVFECGSSKNSDVLVCRNARMQIHYLYAIDNVVQYYVAETDPTDKLRISFSPYQHAYSENVLPFASDSINPSIFVLLLDTVDILRIEQLQRLSDFDHSVNFVVEEGLIALFHFPFLCALCSL